MRKIKKPQSKKFDIGVIGLGVMSQNLVRNMLNKGIRVALHNRTHSKAVDFCSQIVTGTFASDTFDVRNLGTVFRGHIEKKNNYENLAQEDVCTDLPATTRPNLQVQGNITDSVLKGKKSAKRTGISKAVRLDTYTTSDSEFDTSQTGLCEATDGLESSNLQKNQKSHTNDTVSIGEDEIVELPKKSVLKQKKGKKSAKPRISPKNPNIVEIISEQCADQGTPHPKITDTTQELQPGNSTKKDRVKTTPKKPGGRKVTMSKNSNSTADPNRDIQEPNQEAEETLHSNAPDCDMPLEANTESLKSKKPDQNAGQNLEMVEQQQNGLEGDDIAKNCSSDSLPVGKLQISAVQLVNVSEANTNSTNPAVRIENPSSENLCAFEKFKDFVKVLSVPRKIILLIPSGDPIDAALNQLDGLLAKSDIVMDFGNSFYKDTARRAEAHNFNFMGVGISGGSKGALEGPSLMVGGAPKAYENVQSFLEKICAENHIVQTCISEEGLKQDSNKKSEQSETEKSASSDSVAAPRDFKSRQKKTSNVNASQVMDNQLVSDSPTSAVLGCIYKCVDRFGPAETGHFVKMVHNAIEYAEMALLAEIRCVLQVLAKLEKCTTCTHSVLKDQNAYDHLLKTKTVPHHAMNKHVQQTFFSHLDKCTKDIDADLYTVQMLRKIISEPKKLKDTNNALNTQQPAHASTAVDVNALTDLRKESLKPEDGAVGIDTCFAAESCNTQNGFRAPVKEMVAGIDTSSGAENFKTRNGFRTSIKNQLAKYGTRFYKKHKSNNSQSKYDHFLDDDAIDLFSVEKYDTDTDDCEPIHIAQQIDQQYHKSDQKIEFVISRDNGLQPYKFTEIIDGFLPNALIKVCNAKIGGEYIINYINDAVQNKGTGLWAVQEALRVGVPLTLTTAALHDRFFSNLQDLRNQFEEADERVRQRDSWDNCERYGELHFHAWFHNQRKKSLLSEREIMFDDKMHISMPSAEISLGMSKKKNSTAQVSDEINQDQSHIQDNSDHVQMPLNAEFSHILTDSIDNEINASNFSINYVTIRHALNLARAINYCQNLELIQQISQQNNWNVDLLRVINVWKQGTIIQSTFLDEVQHMAIDGALETSQAFADRYLKSIDHLRKFVMFAYESNIPIHCFSAALGYIDSLTTENPNGNVIQAMRDAFGAHGVKMKDSDEFVSLDWDKLVPPDRSW